MDTLKRLLMETQNYRLSKPKLFFTSKAAIFPHCVPN